MRKFGKFSRVFICLLAAGCLFLGTAVQAAGNKETTKGAEKVEKEVQDVTQQQAGKEKDSIVQEAVTALAETEKAVKALEEKKKQEALDALAVATGKLEIIVTREPEMAKAPIDVRVEQFDLYATVDAIKAAVKQAEDFLEDGEVQKARRILGNLGSEINIVVTALPLKGYADGLKAVAKLVDQEKYQEAREALYSLLSTTVVTTNVIPLPILRAEELIKKAEKLTETEGRSDEQNNELTTLLDDAVAQIEMAEALGYGDKKEYKEFYRHIKEIRKKTEGGKFGTGFVDELMNSLKKFKEKIFSGSDESAK